MKQANNISVIFILLVLILSLLSNILIDAKMKNISFFSIRNLFLIALTLIVIINNRATAICLIGMSILFWINFIFFDSNSSYYSNQVIYYTDNIFYIFFDKNKTLHKVVLNIPLISNLLILIFVIPYRLKLYFLSLSDSQKQ